VDSIEGVSHALRTSEYNDRNDQYFWVLDALKLRKPAIEDYSRLNMVYTLLSKRKLTWFVNEGYVNGWDDPRFPTVRGMLRRGLEVEALRRFVVEQGFSKNTNLMEWDKIWNFNKKLIDPVVHRYTVVSKDEKVLFELEDKQNWEEFVDIDLHPKNKEVGTKSLLRSGKIWLELADAQEIAENEEVTLIGWGNAIIKSIEKDAQGQITKLRGKTHLEGSVKTTKKKLTWIAQTNNELKKPIQITLVDLDYLITVPSLEEGMSFESVLRPKSETWKETSALGEFEMRNVRKGQTIQVNRRGFYKCDRAYESDEKPAILFFIPDGRTKAASLLIKQ
jgi:glutamyl-tRNA synthetase